MKLKNLIIILISIFFLTHNVEAAGKKFQVLLSVVPTSEKALVSETKSYITRELRALHDVVLLNDDPESKAIFISIFPFSLKVSNGINTGVGISYVIEKDNLTEHNVLIGGPNDLKTLCERVVAYFDTYWLEPKRNK
jgi:hypothetical protein